MSSWANAAIRQRMSEFEPSSLVDAYLYVANDDLEACPFPKQLAEHIEERKITILGIAKLLAAALTSPEDDRRARGIRDFLHERKELMMAYRHFFDFSNSGRASSKPREST